MNQKLDDLAVAISTSGRSIIQEGEITDTFLNLVIGDIPVVVAEFRMYLPKVDKELKDNIDSVLMNINTVYVNSDIRKVFIGQDINIDDTALVLYYSDEDTEAHNKFFKRWEETETLIFEYSLIRINGDGKDKGIISCVSGLYSKGKWVRLKIISEPIITIKEEP